MMLSKIERFELNNIRVEGTYSYPLFCVVDILKNVDYANCYWWTSIKNDPEMVVLRHV